MSRFLSMMKEFWKDAKDYVAYIGEEFRNAGRDEDNMIAWELQSIPVAPNLKATKFKTSRGYGRK